MEKRIDEIPDAEERAKCKSMRENSHVSPFHFRDKCFLFTFELTDADLHLFMLQAMLNHIKHSIVSLQIAKNMANPMNGVYNGPIPSDFPSKPAEEIMTENNAPNVSVGSSNNTDSTNSNSGIIKADLENLQSGNYFILRIHLLSPTSFCPVENLPSNLETIFIA